MQNTLDFSISDQRGRVREVDSILSESPRQTKSQLSALADYILKVSDPGTTQEERGAEYPIVTDNRKLTIRRRELSAESMVVPGTTSEEVLSGLTADPSSSRLDCPRAYSPDVTDWRVRDNERAIESLNRQAERATGKRRFDLKKQVITKYQERRAIQDSILQATPSISRSVSSPAPPPSVKDRVVVEPGTLLPRGERGLTMCDEGCVRALLSNYGELRLLCQGDARSDVAAMLIDLDEALGALTDGDQSLARFVELKLSGSSDEDVAAVMAQEFGQVKSPNSWKVAWNRTLPRLVADRARRNWVLRNWGAWKRCRGCGRSLPAHPLFFTKNTSPDGFYSRCKECRAAKRRKERASDDVGGEAGM